MQSTIQLWAVDHLVCGSYEDHSKVCEVWPAVACVPINFSSLVECILRPTANLDVFGTLNCKYVPLYKGTPLTAVRVYVLSTGSPNGCLPVHCSRERHACIQVCDPLVRGGLNTASKSGGALLVECSEYPKP